MSVEILSVSKTYGNQKAVNEVSFSIKKGEIVAFLGPNGAGKSTLIKIIAGFINPSVGNVIINGINVGIKPIEIQKNIGYIPEHNPLYLDMYVREYLQFRASIFKIKKSSVEQTIERVGLTYEVNKKIEQLSKGYRQRVGLAAAILHDPHVLILDEPTTGLDPNNTLKIRDLIRDLGRDKIILFSTHIMQEVEAICNRVLIINKGNLVVNKTLKELQQNKEHIIEVTFDHKIKPSFIEKLPNIVSFNNTHGNNWILNFTTVEDMRHRIFDFAQENNLKILQLSTKNKNLETLFKEFTDVI